MTTRHVQHLTIEERRRHGKEAANRTPAAAHRRWVPATGRPDPVALLEEQDRTREQDLVPVRHGRMMVSPFTFYRGAAKVMAADLAATPTAGLMVQMCGDAHLSNFGGYASPERHLVFDLNDFDETLPGPFEYDVKRLAASFTIAAQNNGFARHDVKAVTLTSVAGYRTAMQQFAQMGTMELWYAHLSEEEVRAGAIATLKGKRASKELRRGEKNIDKAHTRDSLQALSKLAEHVDARYRIVSQPPVVIPARDFGPGHAMSMEEVQELIDDQFHAYRETLQHDRRHLLERFHVEDAARKVVGVGSVGTRAFIVLLQGRDEQDPLFLQVKEATRSVFEDHLPKSRFRQHGQRVVQGQRMMQASSDIFLGWTRGLDTSRHFYWRQLRDMKGSALVDEMSPTMMGYYAKLCGWTLARAHARSGDAVAIGEYLGESEEFDRAITNFAKRYARQNERDHHALVQAVGSGRLHAETGV
ncbi:DUF2252 domain-containing protein [Pedococcus sp. KACC 23699]|uniref:DUF2252 domain-containing protein n=1 Tax=Pedococcus sp. KACC 23699 TaxID=3149228 RepID=A0AAU7JPL1_9MICO